MFASVMVPLDGSPFAEAALPAAFDLVRRSNGVLHIARVHQSLGLPTSDEPVVIDLKWTESVRAEENAYLARVGESAAVSIGAGCVTHLLDGVPAEAVAECARSEGIELIVIASHGRGGVSRFWLGSVADALARRSPAPILLIRPPEDEMARVVAPTVRNLLVPIDGSELSLAVLPVALSFARAMDSRITLLRVVPTMPGPAVFGHVPIPELAAEARVRANAELDEIVTRLRGRGFDAHHVVLEGEAPALAIIEYARQPDVYAIAMATHGRGGLSRLAIGSVADRVRRGVKLPVLLLRPTPSGSLAETAV